MKKQLYLLFVLVFLTIRAAFAQIDVVLSGCGMMTFFQQENDSTGRHIYRDLSGMFAIQWNISGSQ